MAEVNGSALIKRAVLERIELLDDDDDDISHQTSDAWKLLTAAIRNKVVCAQNEQSSIFFAH